MNVELNKLLERVIEISNDESIRSDLKKQLLKICLNGHATDILNLYKNIVETSLNDSDKEARVTEMCLKYDIYKSLNNFR